MTGKSGRPLRAGAETTPLTFRVTLAEKDQIREAARAHRLTMSDLLRIAAKVAIAKLAHPKEDVKE